MTVAFTATVNLAVCEPMLVYVAPGDTLIEVTESRPRQQRSPRGRCTAS